VIPVHIGLHIDQYWLEFLFATFLHRVLLFSRH
jgi:hypothetical protein